MLTSLLKKTTPAASRAAEPGDKNGRTLPAVPVLQNQPVQKMEADEEELLQGKFAVQRQAENSLLEEDEPEDGAIQLKSAEEEELPLQGKFTLQKKELEEELPIQGKFISAASVSEPQVTTQRFTSENLPVQKKENKTGLPDNLKEGVESLSGLAMDDVRVHYNSDKPAQLQAHAYAQGTDIHIGAGQEKHLPHEAWHVVQQKQERVQPTMQMRGGIAVNDNQGLESEADVMGTKALQMRSADQGTKGQIDESIRQLVSLDAEGATVQRKISYNVARYPSREALVEALYAVFDQEAHSRIDHWVEEYEKAGGRAIYATTVYGYIIDYLRKEDFKPTFAKASFSLGSSHGPMLPDQVDRHSEADPEAALKTFNFSSVTLGRLTVLGRDNNISFQDRQIDSNFHAEDGLMEQLEAYILKHKIDTKIVRINLTINNFFCALETTTKSKASQNCLKEIIALQKKYKFAHFHVYFQNTYGLPSLMSASIEQLQAAGILVTAFTSTEDAPYHNKLLDPASESEEDESSSNEEMKSVAKRSKKYAKEEKGRYTIGKKGSKDQKEQDYLGRLLEMNNCLINAIARPGLGRNANIGELVAIRLEMRDRGFKLGQMLVASPAIILIILQRLGINRGVRVIYQGSNHPEDRVLGLNTIIIDHRHAHFQERPPLVRARRKYTGDAGPVSL